MAKSQVDSAAVSHFRWAICELDVKMLLPLLPCVATAVLAESVQRSANALLALKKQTPLSECSAGLVV